MDNSRPPIDSLTGLRFFAAYAIVIKHTGVNIFRFMENPLTPSFHELALLGMSLFFVLSGIVIHYNYGHKIGHIGSMDTFKFLLARFARLYPLFFALLVFDLICGNTLFTLPSDELVQRFEAIPYMLTMTQSWFYLNAGSAPLDSAFQYSVVSWSIATEFFSTSPISRSACSSFPISET